ncbi:hypothetical protein PR001_g29697 [Phytophthora rubi]|uniref:Secreted protein n=1 Tax=Phytophthora rubi TaxID=129364 RepID=A0A6A3H0H7_9STRA|nr:hypothetical protein PR001_g29697 [Phytophthora rubi]
MTGGLHRVNQVFVQGFIILVHVKAAVAASYTQICSELHNSTIARGNSPRTSMVLAEDYNNGVHDRCCFAAVK